MTPEQIRQLARRVPLFHGLQESDVSKIVARGMTVRMIKGDTLFYKGTSGNQMYVVLAGKLGVYNGDSVIATLRPGDMCGEMALVNRETRSATVKVEEDSLLFVLTETTLNKLLTNAGLARNPESMSLLFDEAQKANILCSIRTLFNCITCCIST